MDTIERQVEAVRSREDLAAVVRSLVRQHADGQGNWENTDLGAYLEALAAWVEDMDGYFLNRGERTPSQPSWKTIAQILAAARIYE